MPKIGSLPELAEWETELEPFAERGELRLAGAAGRVTLISPYGDISSTGIRTLAASLRRAGIGVRMIFLPISQLESRGDIPSEAYYYPPGVLEQVSEHCQGSVFVGISFMSNYYDRVTQLCRHLRRSLLCPVVLGGVHPTLEPDQCAKEADYICIGEGEEAVVELADKLAKDEDAASVRNIWAVNDGAPVKGPLRPLIRNLDALPFPDYELNDDFVLYEDQLVRMTPDSLEFFMQEGPVRTVTGTAYYIMLTSRGCKFNCSYCCNTALRNLYGKQEWVRYRTPASVVNEAVQVRQKMPFIGSIFICDDSFFERSLAEIERFSELYRERVGLPLFCLGTPYGITEEKMRLLTDAGLRYVQMGIQTGSARTSRLYRRAVTNQRVLAITNALHKFADRTLPPRYDIIVDNPFETGDDVVETIKLLSRIKRPYFIQYFCLTLLPGTELCAKAVEEGLLKDVIAEVYRKQLFYKRKTYLNCLLYLFNTFVPPSLIRLLAAKPFRFLFDRRYFERMVGLLVRLRKRLLGAPSEGIRGLLRR